MSDARLRLAYGGLHPDRLAGLVETYGSAAAVVAAVRSRRIDVQAEVRRAILEPAAARRRELEAAGIAFVGRDDPQYPASLRAFGDAPPGLFVRGNLPSTPAVAVGRVALWSSQRAVTMSL